MKIQIKTIGYALFSVLVYSNGWAAGASATVEAKVIMSMSMGTLRGLSFGAMSVGASAGSVTIVTDGTVVANGGVTISGSENGGTASFQLVGEPDSTYTVQLPTEVLLTDENGNTMRVNGFASDPAVSGQLDANGVQTLNVGATLNVAPQQPYGNYSGLMNVSVNYN